MAKQINRRAFLRMAGGMAAGAALAACQPKTVVVKEEVEKEVTRVVKETVKETVVVEGTPKVVEKEVTKVVKETVVVPVEPEAVTIDYWLHWPQYERVVDQIQTDPVWREMMGPNTVNISVGVTSEIKNANIAAGTPPEVSQVGWMDLRDGLIFALDEFVAGSEIVSPENYIASAWEKRHYEGQLFGVPANESFLTVGLAYNAEMVEAAGLDPDSPPVTWDEAYAWHEKLTKFDDAGNLVQIGLDPFDAMGGGGPTGSFPVGLSWGFQSSWYDEENKSFNWDTEEVADAFDTLAKFIKLIGPDNLVGMRAVEGQGTWGGSYNAKVQAMLIEGYWHPGETANEAPDVSAVNRCTWVPVPEYRRGSKVQAVGGHSLGLYKDAKHPEAGWPVIEYFSTNSGMDIMFKTLGWLIPHIPYLDAVDPSVYPGLDFYFRSATEANEWHQNVQCPIGGFVNQKWNQMREAVYRDEMTGAQAAAELQAVCEQELIDAGYG